MEELEFTSLYDSSRSVDLSSLIITDSLLTNLVVRVEQSVRPVCVHVCVRADNF